MQRKIFSKVDFESKLLLRLIKFFCVQRFFEFRHHYFIKAALRMYHLYIQDNNWKIVYFYTQLYNLYKGKVVKIFNKNSHNYLLFDTYIYIN